MKKGFTMIELIFVIVILGILAAVAIPRLAATRDDAEVAKAAINVSTVISDLGAYYTSQAKFADNISDMTNVAVSKPVGSLKIETAGVPVNQAVTLLAAGKACLTLTVHTEEDKIDASGKKGQKKAAYMAIAQGGDSAETICNKIWNDAAIQKLATGEFYGQTYKCKMVGQPAAEVCGWEKDEKATQGVPLVGLGVVR